MSSTRLFTSKQTIVSAEVSATLSFERGSASSLNDWTLARELRLEYREAIYHVMNRRDRHEPIFRDAENCERFLATFSIACTKTGWQTRALYLMNNHFYLVLETPARNLVSIGRLQMGTTRYVNNRLYRQRKGLL